MKNTFNPIFFYLFLFIVTTSCKKEHTIINVAPVLAKALNETLNCKTVSLDFKENNYILAVKSTNLKTALGKEMAASISAIQLYEEVARKNNTLPWNTSFQIIFEEQNEKYSYDLEQINHAINGQDIISTYIENIKTKNVSEQHPCNSDFDLTSLTIEDYAFAGFSQTEELICGVNRKRIVWRTFIYPENKQILFYVDGTENRLIKISESK